MFDKQRRFVADAAHELRSPITALSVQAENLGHAGLSDDGRVRLDSLRAGIRRTAHLLEQLLALARYDADADAEMPDSEFDRIVKEVVADLLPVAQERSIDLGFARIENVSVRGDPVALAMLVRNLIDNALRHTPAGGRVDVSLFRQNEAVILQVVDTGPGILDAEIDRIFEPFFRGSRSRGDGTGLGLSIVRRIAERCHGSIRLENVGPPDGPGLSACVSFPAVRDDVPSVVANASIYNEFWPSDFIDRRSGLSMISHSPAILAASLSSLATGRGGKVRRISRQLDHRAEQPAYYGGGGKGERSPERHAYRCTQDVRATRLRSDRTQKREETQGADTTGTNTLAGAITTISKGMAAPIENMAADASAA